jgi:hypothetical protein
MAGCSRAILADEQMDESGDTISPSTPSTPTRARNLGLPILTHTSSARFRTGTNNSSAPNSFAPLAGLTDRLRLAREASLDS